MNGFKMIPVFLFVIFALFGFSNAQDCSANCKPAPDSGVVCDAVTYKCLYGCKDGFAGEQCNIQCCGGCKTCSADNFGITCSSCYDGFYMETSTSQCYPCSRSCAENATSVLAVCDPLDGSCRFGCKAGLSGAACDQACSGTCRNGVCDQHDSSCTNGCVLPVLTGSTCSEACSEGCKQRECDQSGICTADGCAQGYWGRDCSFRCSKNCIIPNNNVDAVCDQRNATCLRGCVNNTFWGANCTNACSKNCVNQKCDFANGNCLGGCVENWEGPQCLDELKGGIDTKTIIIASAVGGGVFLIILIIVVCCICKKCRD